MPTTTCKSKFINDRYLLRKSIGQGGMGQVLLVEDSWNNYKPVALKKMRHDKFKKNEVSNLRREFLAVAHLSHPNLAQAFDFGSDWANGDPFFTSEFVDGVHLDIGLKDAGLEPLLEAFVQTCRGLEFIHNHGFVHGDIKPENILLHMNKLVVNDDNDEDTKEITSSLLIKLIDFGLTVRERGFVGKKIVGTAYYVAPEAILGAMSDRRTDLYSLGIVFYLLTTGKLPFKGKSNIEILKGHLEKTPPSPHEVNSRIPLGLSHLIMRLMAKKPNQRPSSAANVISMLSDISGRHFPLETKETKIGYIKSISFIGRKEELQTLKTVTLHNLNMGQSGDESINVLPALNGKISIPENCSLILLEGEKGIGKARLIQELKLFAETRGALVISNSGEKLIEDLSCKLKTNPDVNEIIENLISLSLKQPLLLLINGMQNCDKEAVNLLFKIMETNKGQEHASQILTFVTSKVDYRSSAFVEFLLLEDVQSNMITLKLENLSEVEIRKLVDNTFPENRFSPTFTDQVAAESEGNPASALEILQALLEEDKIRRKNKNWVTTFNSLSDIVLPETGRKNFEQKIANLSQDSRNLARIFSVLDGNFSLAIIAKLSSLSSDKLLPSLTELKNKCILISVNSQFTFASRSIREILHSQLEEAKKKEVHHKVASMLESEKVSPEILFRHYFFAEDEENTIRYGLKSIKELHAKWNFEQALDILQQLKSLPSWPNEIKYELLRAEFLIALSQNRNVENLLIALLDKQGLRDKDKSSIMALLSNVKIKLGQIDEAAKSIQEGIRLAKGLSDLNNITELLYMAAILFHSKGEYLESSRTIQRALKAVKQTKEKKLTWRMNQLQAENYFQLGKLDEALISIGKALEFLDKHKDIGHISASLKGLAIFWKYRDYPGKSIMQLQICLSICDRLGLKDDEAECLIELADLHLGRGEITTARRHLRRAVKILEETGNHYQQLKAKTLLAESAWQVGYYEEAKTQSNAAKELSNIFKNDYVLTRSETILSCLYVDQGNYRKAEKILLSALKCSDHAQSIREIAKAQAYIASNKGKWEKVFNLLKKSMSNGNSFHPVYTLLFSIACSLLGKIEELKIIRKGLHEKGIREDIPIIKSITSFISGLIHFSGALNGSGVSYFQEALQLARSSKYDRLITWICLFYGRALIKERKFEQAYLVLEEGLFLSKRLNLILLKGFLWLEMGILEIKMPGGKFDRSLSYLNSAETIGKKYGFREILSLSRITKGTILGQYGQFDKARSNLQSGISDLEKLIKNNKNSLGKDSFYQCKLKSANEEKLKISKLSSSQKTVQTAQSQGFFGLLGKSISTQKTFQKIASIKATTNWIWVSGPKGSGKTLVSNAIHQFLKGEKNKILHYDCININKDNFHLVLSELEKNGTQTLVLEEISNLSGTIQSKLTTSMPKTLLRIIATTAFDIEELFETKVLSQKIFSQGASHIHLLPLKERKKDIEVLINHYLRCRCSKGDGHILKISTGAKEFLLDYSWPRNVEELIEFCEKAYTFTGEKKEISKTLSRSLLSPTATVR